MVSFHAKDKRGRTTIPRSAFSPFPFPRLSVSPAALARVLPFPLSSCLRFSGSPFPRFPVSSLASPLMPHVLKLRDYASLAPPPRLSALVSRLCRSFRIRVPSGCSAFRIELVALSPCPRVSISPLHLCPSAPLRVTASHDFPPTTRVKSSGDLSSEE